MPSTIIQAGKTWHGFSKIQYLIIFGDSYSSIRWDYQSSPHPTIKSPLGVTYPGVTYTEPGKPNWVGHLVKSRSSKLVYDYARGNDFVSSLERQIIYQFLPNVAKKPSSAPWEPQDTLFMTWIGINDLALIEDIDGVFNTLKGLFRYQERLYASGARNFLLFDLPPIHRSPSVRDDIASVMEQYQTWNETLEKELQSWTKTHPDVTTFLFSSWDSFSRVLDDPNAFGFDPNDISEAGGAIWVDRLRPTSAMHRVIADDLVSFLDSHSPHVSDQPDFQHNRACFSASNAV
ncbi:uncharacterized protein EDB93DRAFT_1332106 [Suillus bovinus]|uniref:uncharacterized protein n=1 Tax=Suillus bovinus TaxID=48563 RepID=UPI001B86B717|nr:uncharacterized protein EDB93DRAFT_1332106 [Suillus bovinus]KAG2130185.1 hypothetical protein EDB93DRAFT_1332106 [Suillus bovinus]